MKIDREFWNGKRIFITGGCGFIGSHLTSKLVSLGAIVKLFTHNEYPENKELIGFDGDLTYAYLHYRQFLLEYKPEIVFHLAAQAIVGTAMEQDLDTVEINIKGTYNLLHVCKNVLSIKSFLHVSTDKVFGSIEEITDTSSLLGVSHPYNASKLCGDVLAQMYATSFNIPITIVRNGNIYGPNDLHWDRLIPRTIKNIFEGKSPVCRGGSRDYIYVDDIVTGYLKLVELRYGKDGLESVCLGATAPTDTVVIIDKIRKLMNRENVEIKFESLWKGELVNQHILEGKAKKLIAWCPEISLDVGLQATVRWYEAYLKRMASNEQN